MLVAGVVATVGGGGVVIVMCVDEGCVFGWELVGWELAVDTATSVAEFAGGVDAVVDADGFAGDVVVCAGAVTLATSFVEGGSTRGAAVEWRSTTNAAMLIPRIVMSEVTTIDRRRASALSGASCVRSHADAVRAPGALRATLPGELGELVLIASGNDARYDLCSPLVDAISAAFCAESGGPNGAIAAANSLTL